MFARILTVARAGALAEYRLGLARLFVNLENLGAVRQTRYQRLVRPSRASDGRWTTDAWAPLEGRVINGGVRLALSAPVRGSPPN